MAEKAISLNDKPKAIVYYKKSLNIRANDKATYINIANLYQDINDSKKAIEYYKKSLTQESQDSDIHVNIANLYDQDGDIKNAIKHYNIAISINPSDADAYINMGFLLQDIDKNNEALSFFNKALDQKPDDLNLIMNIADCYDMLGDKLNAIRHYQMALYIQPKDNDALLSLAFILIETEDFIKAENLLHEIIEQKTSAAAYMNLAHVYICINKIDLAKEYYNLSLEKHNTEEDFYNDLNEDFYIIKKFITKNTLLNLIGKEILY